jgi:hypothetical protein
MKHKTTKAHVTISEDISNDSSGPSVASESESPDEYQLQTKKKPQIVKVPAGDAMTKILGKKLNTIDSGRPILAGAKLIEKELDKEKQEFKVRKALTLEKKEKARSFNVKPSNDAESIEFERQLKKIATRGVVKLFNAIRDAQHGEKAKAAPVTAEAIETDKAAWSVFHDEFATNPTTYDESEESDADESESDESGESDR